MVNIIESDAQWNNYNLPFSFPLNYTLNQIVYSSPQTVWARYATFVSPTYKSLNGGASFDTVNNYGLSNFLPINDTISYALNYYGKLLRSDNGATTFIEIPIKDLNGDSARLTKGKLLDMYFYNDSVGWVMGDDTLNGCKEIWTTSNGGLYWSRVPCPNIDVGNASFKTTYRYEKSVASGIVYIKDSRFADNRTFIRVSDFGNKWQTIRSNIDMRLFHLGFLFVDSMIGMASTNLPRVTLIPKAHL